MDVVVPASPVLYGRVFIPGPLPGTNDYLRARSLGGVAKHRGLRRGNDYQKLKKQWEGTIRLLCSQARIRQLPPCCYTFLFFEANRQRNPDNIASFTKFFFDALVCKPDPIIPNDGWSEILDFKPWWVVEPRQLGVTVFAADRILEKSEALAYDQSARAARQGVTGYAHRPRASRRVAAE
jgi:hypothetical protein